MRNDTASRILKAQSVKATLDDEKNAEFFKNQTVCINSKDRPTGLHANEVHRVTINGVTIPMKVQSRDSKIGEIRLFDSALRKFGVSSGEDVSVLLEQGTRDDEIEWARNTRGNVELRLTIALVDEAARLARDIKSTAETSLSGIERTHHDVLQTLKQTEILEADAKRQKKWGYWAGALGIAFGLLSWGLNPWELMELWPLGRDG